MRKAQVLLGCILLAISITLPQYTGPISAADLSPQESKAARTVRKGSLTDLKSIKPLKEAFQRDSGKVRLITLLSPT